MSDAEPTSYRSFGEQALHYFRREHEAVAREPIAGPAAWRGAELTGRSGSGRKGS